jgi:hypothetical protein
MLRSWGRAAAVAAVAVMAIVSGATGVAGQGDPTGGHNVGDRAGAQNNGTTVTGTAETGGDGYVDPPPGADDGSGGPNCTTSDGTPGYLHYQGLQYTTMEEQRTEIRPEEQRPGVYLHIYCNDEYVDFQFFPDGTPVQVDPWSLARRVTIRPPAPVIHTSPDAGDQLVGLTSWYWVETWQPIRRSTAAGGVRVTVTATPTSLIIDPGDGTGTITCENPPAYDPAVPAADQSSPCTHVYQRAATVTATATLVYETSFTSNVGAGGQLGTIEPTSTVALTVSEAQAINT